MIFKGLILLYIISTVSASTLLKLPPKDVIELIQATNNTLVPNIVYIVDAVECLRQAHSIYSDEQSRAKAFLELFSLKHPGNWTVVVGYSTIISHSSIYVELRITDAGKTLSGDKQSSALFRILN